MTKLLSIGNDIVALNIDDNQQKHHDVRFLQRVLSTDELQQLQAKPSANRLWAMWAAKEAAYKTCHRLQPSLIFSPSKFSVQFISEEIALIQYAYYHIVIHWQWHQEYVHATAYNFVFLEQTLLDDVKKLKSLCEQPWVYRDIQRITGDFSYQQQSRAVRQLALKRLKQQGVGFGDIVRVNGLAPALSQHGHIIKSWQISLSHDDCYAATVLYNSTP